MTADEVKQFYRDWVAELRSGTLTQGRNKLHRVEDDAMCCLGVACVVAGLRSSKAYLRSGFYSYEEESDYMPKSLASKIGLSREKQEKLAEMNDVDYLDFGQIADYIEQEFLKKVVS